MIKCGKCKKEFKNKAGLSGHDRAIHQGIKAGGNPNVKGARLAGNILASLASGSKDPIDFKCPKCGHALILRHRQLGARVDMEGTVKPVPAPKPKPFNILENILELSKMS